MHGVRHKTHTHGSNLRICINHQDSLVEVWRHTRHKMNLAEEVKVKRSHVIVEDDTRKEIHQDNLTVSLSTIPWLGRLCLVWGSALDDNNDWNTLIWILGI